MSETRANGELELDALRALAGADDVRKKLLAGLSMGRPSLEEQAYLIKSRVKDHGSLVKKVLNRRETNPTYCPSNVTDIVGLRILSLYRSELPLILRSFLRFVTWAQSDQFALFAGKNLAEAVSEAIIYRPANPDEVVTQLVKKEFRNHGFALPGDPIANGNLGIPLKEEHRASEYTSIHLVLWCTGITKEFRVPLEVQLRTSLEDVWGEITHHLHYKSRPPEDRDESSTRYYRFAIPQLQQLKNQLDLCSNTADSIEEHIRTVFAPASFETGQNIKSGSVDLQQFNQLALSSPLQERINATVLRLSALYREIYQNSAAPSKDLMLRAFNEFSQAAETFTWVLSEYENLTSQDEARDSHVRYLLMMERAVCLYWRAFWLKFATTHHITEIPGDKDESEDVKEAIKVALQEYLKIAKDPRFAKDAILAFRLGNVLSLHGESVLALDRYREAVDRLPDSPLPPKHYMRVRLPRQLGLALWEAGEEIKRKAMTLEAGDTLDQSRLQYYLEALEVTKKVRRFEIEESYLDQGEKQTDQENRITINNVLEYATSFLNAGGTWDELRSRDFTPETMKELLKELEGAGLHTVDNPSMADTIRAVARVVGDRGLARRAAQRVIELIARRDFTIPLSDEVFEEMRRDAVAELDEKASLSLTRAASSENPAQTISTLTALLGLWPDDIQALEELVRRLLEQNELDKAEETLRQGLKNDPESPRLIGLQGQLLETRGKIPEAIREYRRAARAAPEDDQQSNLLVSALVRAGRQDDALFELGSRLDARPNDARALARRGSLLRDRQDFQKARLDLEKAERLLVSGDEAAAADLLNVRNNLGQTLRALDRFDEAIEVFNRAINVERTSPFDARSLKASILIDTAEYQAAADLLAETIRLLSATKNDAATARLGWLYHRRGWALQCSGGGGPAEVEQLYRTAIKLSLDHDYAKKDLASLLIHSRQPDARHEGETLLVELTERPRGRSLPLQLLGWCHFLRDRDEAAEQWLRATLPRGPGNVETMVTDAEIECRFDLALVLLAARPEDGQTKAEYDTVIAQARRRPPTRRRGLLYVALQDLVEAASVDRINPDFGRAQWGKLRSELDAVNYPAERLERLRYP
jgi:tetratricopeptide (TPR) repeat protein